MELLEKLNLIHDLITKSKKQDDPLGAKNEIKWPKIKST